MAMRRKQWDDDVPGDIVDEDTDNLPGGFGAYNPDRDVNAMVDAAAENDILTPGGEVIAHMEQHGGIPVGNSYAEAANEGSTVDPDDLLTEDEGDELGVGGLAEDMQYQQRRDLSVESEGPFGDQHDNC